MARTEKIVEKYFGNPEVLLGFMRRTRKPVFHKSNLFFRDIQFAVRDYFDAVERSPITLPEAERMAHEIVERYTTEGILRPVNNQAFCLEYPEWKTPAAGTYAMLTIHGAPLPVNADAALEAAVQASPAEIGSDAEPILKGGDESPDGNRVAELILPIAPPKNAEPGHLDGRPFKPGEREYQFHRDPQAGTDDKPEPGEKKSEGVSEVSPKPKIAPPPWIKK